MSCTIVTAYFRSPSKYNTASYDEWITNFLTTIDNEMVIFCDKESFQFISKLRMPFANKTRVVIIELEALYCNRSEFLEYWKKDIIRDHEKDIHNINLYIIWNEKPFFVHKVIEKNPFNSEFFMWCDIGCFRYKEELSLFKRDFPSKQFLNTAKKDKMYFLNIFPFQKNDFEVMSNGLTREFRYVNRIGGTMFIGHKDIFKKYIDMYNTHMIAYMNNDYFTGKDQNIMATIYVLHPELFELVTPVDGEGNPWFYLQRFLLLPVV
jgi:hypothetical protein